jgi:hypothetical protein
VLAAGSLERTRERARFREVGEVAHDASVGPHAHFEREPERTAERERSRRAHAHRAREKTFDPSVQNDARASPLGLVDLVLERFQRRSDRETLDHKPERLHGRDFAPDEGVAGLWILVDEVRELHDEGKSGCAQNPTFGRPEDVVELVPSVLNLGSNPGLGVDSRAHFVGEREGGR